MRSLERIASKRRFVLTLTATLFLMSCFGKTNVKNPPMGQTQPANGQNGAQTQKYNIYEAKGELRVDSEMLRKFFRYVHDRCWKIPVIQGRFEFGQHPMRGGMSADNRQGVFYPIIQVYHVNISFNENPADPESYVTYNPIFIVAYAMEQDKMNNEPRSSDAVGFALNGFRYFYLKYAAEEYARLANEAESKKKVNEAGAQEKTSKAAKYHKAAENWRTEEARYRKLSAECASKSGEGFREEFADGLIYGEYELKMYDNAYPQAYYDLENVIEQNYGPKIRRLEEKRNTVQWKKQKIDSGTYDALRTEYRLKNGGVPFSLAQNGQTLNLFVKYWAEPDSMDREKYSARAISEPNKKWNYVFVGAEARDGYKPEGNRIREVFEDPASHERRTYYGRVIVGGLWAEPFADEFQSRIVLVKAPFLYPMEAAAAVMLVRRDGSSTVIFIKDAAKMSLELRELPPEETACMLQVSDGQKLLISAEVEKNFRDEKRADFQ